MARKSYEREQVGTLVDRLREPPRFLIIVAGPRQVGKTRLVRDALTRYAGQQYTFAAVDQPDVDTPSAPFLRGITADQIGRPKDVAWLVERWEAARAAARRSDDGHILVLDEIQKIPRWSDAVKGLWDADRAEGLGLRVALLGSSPLLMQKGMSEALTGRYELIRLTHWSYMEMYEAFDFDLDDYLYFGGYPGSAIHIRDEPRWRRYLREGLIQPSIEQDILMMTRVDKPALLSQLFLLGCEYSGQLLSYTKMIGQLQDAGNTVTLAHYLDLLGKAGLIEGLQKYAGRQHRRRSSAPKLNVLNTALMTAESGYTKAEARADRSFWGHLVESAVGAHLRNTGHPECELYYWRQSPHEVDFVLARGKHVTAVEVKSGQRAGRPDGLDAFEAAFGNCRKILVGDGGISIVEFLTYPAEHWL